MLGVHSVPSSRSLTNKLRLDPAVTPGDTTSCSPPSWNLCHWSQPSKLCRSASSQLTLLSVHSDHTSWAYLCGCFRRQFKKNLPEGSADTMYCSLLIYPASHSITGGNLIGLVWLPLGQSVLTTPDDLLLHVLDDDNQDDLFYLFMDGGATVA